MEIMAGKSILERIVSGRLRFLDRSVTEVVKSSLLSREEEEGRFRWAQRQAVLQLTGFYHRASQQVEEKVASIFAIHAMLLEDVDFVEAVHSIIWEMGTTAEYAVQTAGKALTEAFAGMDDPYMKARAADFRDISRRVMWLLLGKHGQDPLREGPAILVADDFLPSEVMDLGHQDLLGLVARKGSVDSHTAILLRAYGIPAMAEVELGQEWDGHMALLDGFGQRLYVDPASGLEEELRARYQLCGSCAE